MYIMQNRVRKLNRGGNSYLTPYNVYYTGYISRPHLNLCVIANILVRLMTVIFSNRGNFCSIEEFQVFYQSGRGRAKLPKN